MLCSGPAIFACPARPWWWAPRLTGRDSTERARLVEQVRAATATATTQPALHSHALHGLLQQTPASTLRARAAGNVPHFSINLKNISSNTNIITFYNAKTRKRLKVTVTVPFIRKVTNRTRMIVDPFLLSQ